MRCDVVGRHGCCAVLILTGLLLGCTDGPRVGETEAALGAGPDGPVAMRIAPTRRHVKLVAGTPIELRVVGSDPQGDLSGADFYLDGELAAQQHVGDVGGSGATAVFDHLLGFDEAGEHVVVARAFDRQSAYSERVVWNLSVAPRQRALYVAHLIDGTDQSILGNPQRADELVAHVGAHGVTSVIFYQLRDAIPAQEAALVSLIDRLQAAGVAEIGAPIGGQIELDGVEGFNQRHPAQAFTLLVTEEEYWQSCSQPPTGYGHECPSCRAVCFPPFLALLEATRALAAREAAAGRHVVVAAYLGYPSDDEAEQIAALVDRVFLNYHGADPAAAYARAYVRWGAMRARLHAFSGGDRQVEVWPIFYRCGEANMRPWLDSQGEEAAEAAFLTALGAEPAGLRADVVVPGFAYFRYGSPSDPACPGPP